MPTVPITQALGGAERGLRALLARELQADGLEFPAWTALVFADASGGLTAEALAVHFASGHIADPSTAPDVLAQLAARGWVGPSGSGAHPLTSDGARRYRDLRQRIDRVIDDLTRGIDDGDLAATRRVLAELARRAAAQLAAPRV